MKFRDALKWWGPFLRYIGCLPIGLGAARWRCYLFEQQDGACFYCGQQMSLTNRLKNGQPARDFATFEHLKRREDGGTNSAENLVLAHRKCNARKNVEDQRKKKKP